MADVTSSVLGMHHAEHDFLGVLGLPYYRLTMICTSLCRINSNRNKKDNRANKVIDENEKIIIERATVIANGSA